MAIQGYSYGYTKKNSSVGDGGEGRRRDKGEEGERLGKGAPFVKVGRLIFAIQEPGTQVAETVVKVHYTFHQADPLMSMSPQRRLRIPKDVPNVMGSPAWVKRPSAHPTQS